MNSFSGICSHLAVFNDDIDLNDGTTYTDKTPVFIAIRFLKSDFRLVALKKARDHRKMLTSFKIDQGVETNHVAVCCYDNFKNNKRVMIDAVYKCSSANSPRLAARLLSSHGLHLETVTFMISLEHEKVFMVRDSIMRGDFETFTEQFLPETLDLSEKIAV